MTSLKDFINKKYDTYTNPMFYNTLSEFVVETILNDINFESIPATTEKQFVDYLQAGPFKDLYNVVLDYLTYCISYEPEFIEFVDRIKLNAVNEYCRLYDCPDIIPKNIGDPVRLINRRNYINNISNELWDRVMEYY